MRADCVKCKDFHSNLVAKIKDISTDYTYKHFSFTTQPSFKFAWDWDGCLVIMKINKDLFIVFARYYT